MSSQSLKSRAKCISFEGNDGLGKTTQVNILAQTLRKKGKRVTVVKLPRYDFFTGKLIYRMLKSGAALNYPNIFQIIQWFDKIIFQLFYMNKLLFENDYLLFDRWHASMWAYGLAGGANEGLTNNLISTLKVPDLVFLFRGKSKRTNKQDAYEANNLYQNKVALFYVLWACWNPTTQEIDVDDSIENVSLKILDHIKE